MTLDELRAIITDKRQRDHREAFHDLAERRELMELKPLDEPLQKLTIAGYELIPGILAQRAKLKSFDWPAYLEAIDPVESAADAAFWEWLEGMNLRYEATWLRRTEGHPSEWYVTKKVATLAKLTWGGS